MHVHQRRSSTGIGARVVAGIVMASTLIMGGCVDPVGVAPSPIATPSPTFSSPVFASDEEVLAAAEAAYAEYLAMSDLIAQEGGVNPERIAPFVTEQQLAVELDGFASLVEAGVTQTGISRLVSSQLQSRADLRQHAQMIVYFCVDFGATSFIRQDGSKVDTRRAGDSVTVEAGLRTDGPTGLLVDSNTPLEEAEEC